MLTEEKIKEIRDLVENNWDRIIRYAKEEEEKILKYGTELDASQIITAKKMGVEDADAVKYLEAETIPQPTDETVNKICKLIGFLTDNTTGVTFGKGFYLRRKHKATTIPHELVHVSQYEKYGIEGFLEMYKEQYFETVFEKGLDKREIPLEREAYERAEKAEVSHRR